MEIVARLRGSPGNLVGFDAGRSPPALVVLSHLPPVGLTATRHLARLLRERLPEMPVVVGLWGDESGRGRGRFAGRRPGGRGRRGRRGP